MSFKVDVVLNKQAISRSLKRQFRDVVNETELFESIGKAATERIKGEARRARPINDAGGFPGLADKTVSNRKRIANNNKTHPAYSSSRSNVTLTGKFLDSLTWKSFVSKGFVEIFFDGTHPGYKQANGKRTKGPKNADLYQYLFEKGFAAFDKAVESHKDLNARIQGIVRRYLRKSLKNKVE